MNTGQTILTIGAIIFLGLNVLSTNKTSLQHGVILQQTEIGLFAASLASSLLEEAQGKAFDKNSIEGFLTSPTQCTSVDSLGPELGEKREDYNDFDDFNWMKGGAKRDSMGVRCDTIKIRDIDTFLRWSKVCYVDSSSPDVYKITRTFSKKLTVYVWGMSSQDTVQMSYLFSYWSFR
jgi:hypothetical protein